MIYCLLASPQHAHKPSGIGSIPSLHKLSVESQPFPYSEIVIDLIAIVRIRPQNSTRQHAKENKHRLWQRRNVDRRKLLQCYALNMIITKQVPVKRVPML
ncbi:hypothetical protein WL00_27525 [Burkholderia cepacia]|nr:hypothetical protein WL00_27525 [Burkholderia cepacia]